MGEMMPMDVANTHALAPHGHAAAPKPHLDASRVRDIVLARLATAGKVIPRDELARELWPIVSHLLPMSEWQAMLDRDLGALADAGLCDAKPVAVSATEAGKKRALLVLGSNALPRTWTEAKGMRLVAKALDLDNLPPRRLKGLLKPDGLRMEIVQAAFKLKSRSVPTASRLRSQLAKLAVTRAFGDSLPAGLDGRSGLSASAGRALAGRLANPPREFATDGRLVAALAMEHAGTTKPGIDDLQTGLLRRYVTRGTIKTTEKAERAPRRSVKSAVRPLTAVAKSSAATLAPPALQQPAQALAPTALKLVHTAPSRPDFATFVAAVLAAAGSVAEGWPGNRKAFVCKVWVAIQKAHPHWVVSDVEFKAMLVEAHRVGSIVLVNADLKDQRALADLQASAIAYKNAIFHFVRVDD
jgi:hypothetical protein